MPAPSDRQFDPSKTPGGVGAAPSHAPRQVAQDLAPELVRAQLAAARANEQELKPLVFDVPDRVKSDLPPMAWDPATLSMKPAVFGESGEKSGAPPVGRALAPNESPLRMPGAASSGRDQMTHEGSSTRILLTDVDPWDTNAKPTVAGGIGRSERDHDPEQGLGSMMIGVGSDWQPTSAASQSAADANDIPAVKIERPSVMDAGLQSVVDGRREKLDQALAAGGPYRPAESNTDSPARGLPQPIADPGKQVTGGFGHGGEAMYFPVDGAELKEIVAGHLSVIHAQMQNDLRFSPALCYPRVSVKVSVEVGAFATDGPNYDASFEIVKRSAFDKTPLDIAREKATLGEICFVLVSGHEEMTAAGESISPPNQIRADLNLPIKMGKTPVKMGNGQIVLVDLPSGQGGW